jgi:hypothetical protein
MIAAMDLACAEMPGWEQRYNRIGWGWDKRQGNAKFFVRRIKDGLSLRQVAPVRIPPTPATVAANA